MTKQTILQFSMIPLMFIPMTAAVYMGVMEAYMNGVPMAFLKFSRNDEAEADYLGIQYMYKAGYDPNALVGKDFGHTAWAVAFFVHDLAKEADEGVGVVSGLVHVL